MRCWKRPRGEGATSPHSPPARLTRNSFTTSANRAFDCAAASASDCSSSPPGQSGPWERSSARVSISVSTAQMPSSTASTRTEGTACSAADSPVASAGAATPAGGEEAAASEPPQASATVRTSVAMAFVARRGLATCDVSSATSSMGKTAAGSKLLSSVGGACEKTAYLWQQMVSASGRRVAPVGLTAARGRPCPICPAACRPDSRPRPESSALGRPCRAETQTARPRCCS